MSLILLLNNAGGGGLSLKDGLVGYWKMDTVTSPIPDESGNSNALVLTGGTLQTGQIGSAIDMFGATAKRTGVTGLGGLSSITMGGWFNATSGSSEYFCRFRIGAGVGSYLLRNASGKIVAFFQDATPTNHTVTSTNTVSAVNFIHGMLRYDGATGVLSVFADGTKTDSTIGTGLGVREPDDLEIANTDAWADEWGLWSRALSDAEVEAHRLLGVAGASLY